MTSETTCTPIERTPARSPTTSCPTASNPKIAVAYTKVSTIATDDHHTLQEWTSLEYPGRIVQKDLDIGHRAARRPEPMNPSMTRQRVAVPPTSA